MDKLTEKKKEVQSELERWAEEEKVLGPGQQLLFTLQVVSQPTVVESKDPEDCRNMSSQAFFRPKRLVTHGVPHNIAVGIFRSLPNDCDTMDIFVQTYTRRRLRKVKGLGRTSIGHIRRLLREVGLIPL